MNQPFDVLQRQLKAHSSLDADDLASLRALSYRTRHIPPDEDIVRQGDKPEMSVLVVDGMVGRYHMRRGGKRQYLSFHLTGGLPDAQTLFLDRMDHTVCAMGEADIALIPHVQLIRLFDRRPSTGMAIWRETLIDAAIFREAITNNSSRPPLARLAHLFCELYYRARAIGLTKAGSCRIPINQGQIGETLGMSIVTANRTLQELRATRSMEFRQGQLTVMNWSKLAATGEFDPGYLHLKRPSRL